VVETKELQTVTVRRTRWFVPEHGLVELTFQLGEGSVSRVELLG